MNASAILKRISICFGAVKSRNETTVVERRNVHVSVGSLWQDLSKSVDKLVTTLRRNVFVYVEWFLRGLSKSCRQEVA